MPNCRGEKCQIPFTWATSPADRPIPLDARPYGILVNSGIIKADDPKIIRYRLEDRGGKYFAVKDDAGTYVNHWQTCTDPPARR